MAGAMRLRPLFRRRITFGQWRLFEAASNRGTTVIRSSGGLLLMRGGPPERGDASGSEAARS